MSTRVAVRDLRNSTRQVLERVEAGEELVVTVNGRDVARLAPLVEGVRWIPKRVFLDDLARAQADPELQAELDALAPDTTDDLDDLR